MSNKVSTKDIVLTGMFAAVIAVLSQIAIPLPSGVPATLQTFAIALTGVVLGAKMGTAATIVWVLLGTVGVPVFSGFSAGPSHLVGKAGGFIFDFIIMTLICGFAGKAKNKAVSVALVLLGLIIDHICGVIQFKFCCGQAFL